MKDTRAIALCIKCERIIECDRTLDTMKDCPKHKARARDEAVPVQTTNGRNKLFKT